MKSDGEMKDNFVQALATIYTVDLAGLHSLSSAQQPPAHIAIVVARHLKQFSYCTAPLSCAEILNILISFVNSSIFPCVVRRRGAKRAALQPHTPTPRVWFKLWEAMPNTFLQYQALRKIGLKKICRDSQLQVMPERSVVSNRGGIYSGCQVV